HHLPVALVEGARNGWWYSAPTSSGRLVVVHLTDVDLWQRAAHWQGLLSETTHTRVRMHGLEPAGPPCVLMADTYHYDARQADGWLPIGAAALGLDPLSAEGVSFALRSGRDAAALLADGREMYGARKAEFTASTTAMFEEYLRQRRNHYALEDRW